MTVAETLALHFASIADNISDDTAKRLSKNDLSHHSSVTQINVKFYEEQTIALDHLKINNGKTPSQHRHLNLKHKN